MTDRRPGSAIGRYQVRSVIGRGGLATVYACWDSLLDRDVAIKVFSASATTKESVRAQEAEARLAARLNHHALTTLYDAGVEATDPDAPQIYLVMEHVAGADLKQRLERGRLNDLQLSYLGTDLSNALAYVHEHGFLHCDIKPANVLLLEREETSRLRGKLTDFGIASIIGAQSGKGTTTGTAAYLAPEQVEGSEPTPATDVYALGLVLLEAFTGRLEFPGSIEETAVGRLQRDPVIPGDLPQDMREILQLMVERDPVRRITARLAAERFERAAARLISEKKGRVAVGPSDSEDARVSAVRRYGVLDTAPDEAFDRLARLAGRLLDAPVAVVSFIDEHRVFHKARFGADVEEVPRDLSLGPLPIELGEATFVADIAVDERTRNNDLLAEHGLRSYAGAPIRSDDGHDIGAVCVYDVRPRAFSTRDLEGLSEIAQIAMHELELRLAARRAAFDR